MSPLVIQNYDSESQTWYTTGRFGSSDGVGYLVDNMSGGRKRVFIFECAPDDSSTIISLVEGSIRVTNDRILELLERRNELTVYRVLRDSQSYETIVVQENDHKTHQVRFLHSRER